MYYVLCNPLSANKQGEALAHKLEEKLAGETLKFIDIRSIQDYSTFWSTIDTANDSVILAGGDGTLNCFINANENTELLPTDLYYYAAGSGNDFKKDVCRV